MDSFEAFVTAARESRGLPPLDDSILVAFDPGHTTGWCVFGGTQLLSAGQIDTGSIESGVHEIARILDTYDPLDVMIEDYRVFKWRQKQHVGSELLTTQVIGCIKALCAMHGIPTFLQPPHVAKSFCDDKKLKQWDLWQTGKRHANDAIRHGCYFLIFGPLDRRVVRTSKTVG